MKNNKKKVMFIIILVISMFLGIAYYYNTQIIGEHNQINNAEIEEVNNYDTKNVNEYINNDYIISMGSYANFKLYGDTKDKNQIYRITEYLKSLKVEKTEERAPSDTPENSIYFTDKNGKEYSIEFYDSEIAMIKVDNMYLDKLYKFNGFNPKELANVCEEAGLVGK